MSAPAEAPRSAPRRIAAAWVVALGTLAAGGALPADRAPIQKVTMQATGYEPALLNVKRGTTVEWVNKDPFPHTATSAGRFDSGSIGVGRSWKHVFDQPGDYVYTCTFHPNMKATVHVD